MGGQEATSFVLLSYTVLYLRGQNMEHMNPKQYKAKQTNLRV